MAYEKKKTQREIDVENIPDEFGVLKRFYIGVFFVIAVERMHGFRTFCEKHGLDTGNLSRIIKTPTMKFNPQHLSILVIHYGFSAHWLITGEGPMRLNTESNPEE
ncbi:Uncharacterised protein [Chryseobacterium nakagawai]|uniref:Uncharacterized protein n=1 Tax=Chryseobacterium nakagawai TaxID=1241982 RepID=A0AAD0YMD2_CHRNA|nr:hypothetical protein [Chryseobacterium nakagawai]AZA91194.1 hypothetical protein EG343_11400 [Chryseobacterium nakagawai]VEH22760.1 Uncharacterised protein [Chryseobacterium nakagawai]